MIYHLRVPTSEPYAYIEADFEGDAEGAVEEYKRLTALVKNEGGAGVPITQFNALLDEYLSTGTIKNGGDVWENMSKEQQVVFQEIKKSRKRTNK